MVFHLSRGNIGIFALIIAAAIALSFISSQYSINTSEQITKIAADDVRSNAEIQAHDLSNGLINKIDSVATALEILANASTVQSEDTTKAAQLFTSAKSSTKDISSSYFWVDRNGKLLWADAFANKTIEAQYKGGDRSNRDYFIQPKNTLRPYYSSVIESVDGVPRLYVAYPIVGSDGPNNGTGMSANDVGEFRGIVAAALDLDVMGKFLESQLSPKYASTTGLIDRNGIILYSQNTTFIGKDIFGQEVQSILPPEIKSPFNDLLRQSLSGEAGSGDISYLGSISTLAYQPVIIEGNNFAVLYITTPHTFTESVNFLIDQQRIFNLLIIVIIGIVAVGIAIMVLLWNKKLGEIVREKTAELKASNEQLVVNEKMQREFINIAAHELRTPTQAIIGYSELFEMEPGGRDEAMKAVARNAFRLQRLTEDILDVSRIEGKALELHKEKFNISEIINTALEDARWQVANGDLRFVYQDPKDIFIEADKARISQVMSNLLNNAIKFTKTGSIFIVAESNISTSELKVSIVDTGAGIDSEIQRRLFTKFASRSQTGTGLGLFISKSIIEAHGGTITGSNNEDGKGARFSFTLPLEK